jgi:dTDP-glucose 4,6-dehydratase
MKILVTGGAGFIGAAVVRRAIADGHEVVNLDALTYAACLDNVASVADNPAYTFEHADIRDRATLDRIFARHEPDAVMHLAAESHVDRSIDGPGDFIETNIIGTYNMLEAARSYCTGRGKPDSSAFMKGCGRWHCRFPSAADILDCRAARERHGRCSSSTSLSNPTCRDIVGGMRAIT